MSRNLKMLKGINKFHYYCFWHSVYKFTLCITCSYKNRIIHNVIVKQNLPSKIMLCSKNISITKVEMCCTLCWISIQVCM